MSKRIIVPRGLIPPDVTAVIEIPGELADETELVASAISGPDKCKIKCRIPNAQDQSGHHPTYLEVKPQKSRVTPRLGTPSPSTACADFIISQCPGTVETPAAHLRLSAHKREISPTISGDQVTGFSSRPLSTLTRPPKIPRRQKEAHSSLLNIPHRNKSLQFRTDLNAARLIQAAGFPTNPPQQTSKIPLNVYQFKKDTPPQPSTHNGYLLNGSQAQEPSLGTQVTPSSFKIGSQRRKSPPPPMGTLEENETHRNVQSDFNPTGLTVCGDKITGLSPRLSVTRPVPSRMLAQKRRALSPRLRSSPGDKTFVSTPLNAFGDQAAGPYPRVPHNPAVKKPQGLQRIPSTSFANKPISKTIAPKLNRQASHGASKSNQTIKKVPRSDIDHTKSLLESSLHITRIVAPKLNLTVPSKSTRKVAYSPLNVRKPYERPDSCVARRGDKKKNMMKRSLNPDVNVASGARIRCCKALGLLGTAYLDSTYGDESGNSSSSEDLENTSSTYSGYFSSVEGLSIRSASARS